MALLAACGCAAAEGVEFPADSGVVDVRADFGAKGDGAADDTAAIQKALDSRPGGNRIIYLPNGTYLVSDTLKWPAGSGPGQAHKRTILQGQSTDGVVIRLRDSCAGFQELTPDSKNIPRGKPIIWTGQAPAQRFRNAIRNLTVDTGKGNPAAIGVQFIGNNQACVRDVVIRSGDAGGPIGLDLGYSPEQGPCLIENVSVRGFDVGISCWGAVDSITMVNISLAGQKSCGLRNEHQLVSIEALASDNACPAIENLKGDSVLTLINATLKGSGEATSAPAIRNQGVLYARGIKTAGYKLAIAGESGTKTDAPGPDVAEFTSHQPITLAGAKPTALGLPIKPTPRVPWDRLDDWTSPLAFGGKPGDDGDDTEAIQKAIDSGKSTVYLPNGKWLIKGDLVLRGNVRRLIGCEADIVGAGVIHLADGKAPVVIIERLQTKYAPIGIVNDSSRTLVVSSVMLERGGTGSRDLASKPADAFAIWAKGAGDVFIEDVAGEPILIDGGNVWARQLNPEASGYTKITNRGGNLWILGLKTEGGETALEAVGGRTEIVGAFIYANTNRDKQPLMVVRDGLLSLTMGESSFKGKPFSTLVSYSGGGGDALLTPKEAQSRGEGSAAALIVAGSAAPAATRQ
jgi:hypothetical protein